MHISQLLFAATSLPTLSLAARQPMGPSKDAILLSQVKTLTLHRGRQTTHRRVAAVPQTICSGGTAQGLFEPDVIRCANQGADYEAESIQWTCTASLPPEFKLGGTEIICEGYHSSDDQWVLKGSCAVEYRLELTPLGAKKWPGRLKGGWNGGFGSDSENWDGSGGGLPAVLFWGVFVAVAGWIIWAAFIRDSDWWRAGRGRGPLGAGGNDRRPPGGGGGGGGGGGWWPGNDGDDPPPPYSRHDRPSKPSTPNRGQGGRGWQPGFWTGAASGAAATYLANSLSGRNNNTGGPRGAFNRGYDAGVGPSNSRGGGSSSSSSPSYSSSRYESSGFGGTSRR